MSLDRSLYLPVEGLARELDGKLLLALIARERGWRPVIGYKRAIRERRAILPAGIFLSHNARLRKPKMFERMTRFGHRTVVLDEEALVRQTDEIFLLKHDRNAFDHVRLVLCWGQDDAQLWERSALVDPQLVKVTGNPRMDMLRPELSAFHQGEIDAIKGRFGDYVLLNSNFPTVNHFIPTHTTLTFADSTPEEQAGGQKTDFLEHKRAIFERFLALLPRLAAAIAPTKLVIRPHPSELHAPWKQAIANSPNAVVISEGNVVPWIAGAKALIHNGCTSAVEGAALGATVLSYRPVRSETLDNPLPNGVGTECFDDESLLAALSEILERGPGSLSNSQPQLLERHVAALSGPLACDRILDVLEELPQENGKGAERPLLKQLKRRACLYRRNQAKQVKQMLSASGRNRLAYIDRNMSQMTPRFMEERIARFQAALGGFEGRRARPLAKNLFAIE